MLFSRCSWWAKLEFRDVGVVETWKLPRCFCLTTKYHEISHIKQISRIYLKSICVGFLHPENFVRKIVTHFDQQYVFMFLLKPPNQVIFDELHELVGDPKGRGTDEKKKIIPKKTSSQKWGSPKSPWVPRKKPDLQG